MIPVRRRADLDRELNSEALAIAAIEKNLGPPYIRGKSVWHIGLDDERTVCGRPIPERSAFRTTPPDAVFVCQTCKAAA